MAEKEPYQTSEKIPNAYLDVNYAPHPSRIRVLANRVMKSRVFFGDDFPYGGGNTRWNLRRITDAEIGDEIKIIFLYENAKEFIDKYCRKW